MNHKNFTRLYSISRTSRYIKAANGNKQMAQQMYYANARIAQAFQPLISFFEVVLRNQLHYAAAAFFNDVEWIVNQKTGFMSDDMLCHVNKKTGQYKQNTFLKKEVERAEKVLADKQRNVTAGRIIAELNLGFWNSLYEKHHYALLKGVPCRIFNKLPVGYGRKEVNDYIQKIRILRNRVSHNEPLCFNGKVFDLMYVREMYRIISDFFQWINPSIEISLKEGELDRVEYEISRAEKLL